VSRVREQRSATRVAADADIVDAGLHDVILRFLAECPVAATSLMPEITENAMIRDSNSAARNMELLRMNGVRCAINDFVTGYTQYLQLRKLPVDTLALNEGGKLRPISGILPRSGDPTDCLAWLDAPLRRASQPGSATTEASPNQ
jgi:hypothetical protein